MAAASGQPADPTDLREQLQQRELEIALLKEINELASSEYDLQRVFDRVAKLAHGLIDAETVHIAILSPDSRSYTYRAAVGANAGELLGETLPIDVGICGWVLRHRRPWWRGALEELSDNERNLWEKKAGTLIMVPLAGKRQFLGGIAGINKRGGGEFTARDLELLTLFAGQVSIAIENAQFFSELTETTERARLLGQQLEKANERLTRTNEELQHLAVHDPLTNLPNRTLIQDRLQQGILAARRGEEPLALIMIDLDHFKEVNDTLGHHVGDQLLICVGKRFHHALRELDTLGRLGGDEFAVVVPGAGAEAAIVVADKLQAALESPIGIEGTSFSIGASMGIALYPEHGNEPASLLKCADVAMYVAKRNKEAYCVYDDSQDINNPNRLALLGELREALQNKQMEIALQPKLDLVSGHIVGAEALARWVHPQSGPVPPDEFVPVLEKTGLIRPFALQILERAITECGRCRQAGHDISVAVNLSMHNLRDPHLPDQIADLLAVHGIPASCLTLEITESVIMSDPEFTMDVLTRLSGMDIHLSIDDFGTGYSSLSYLKKLPVHQLKIDRSFVRDMTSDADDATIVRSTVDLAHNLGLKVVGEGVESEEVLDAIRMTGCDQVQGYLVSRPLTPERFLQFLDGSPWPVRRVSEEEEAY